MPTSRLCSTVEHLFTATKDGIGTQGKSTTSCLWRQRGCGETGQSVTAEWITECLPATREKGRPTTVKKKQQTNKQASKHTHFFNNRVDQKNVSFQTNKWLRRVEIRAVNHPPNSRADSSRSDIIGTSLCQRLLGRSKKIMKKKKGPTSARHICVCSRRRR